MIDPRSEGQRATITTTGNRLPRIEPAALGQNVTSERTPLPTVPFPYAGSRFTGAPLAVENEDFESKAAEKQVLLGYSKLRKVMTNGKAHDPLRQTKWWVREMLWKPH